MQNDQIMPGQASLELPSNVPQTSEPIQTHPTSFALSQTSSSPSVSAALPFLSGAQFVNPIEPTQYEAEAYIAFHFHSLLERCMTDCTTYPAHAHVAKYLPRHTTGSFEFAYIVAVVTMTKEVLEKLGNGCLFYDKYPTIPVIGNFEWWLEQQRSIHTVAMESVLFGLFKLCMAFYKHDILKRNAHGLVWECWKSSVEDHCCPTITVACYLLMPLIVRYPLQKSVFAACVSLSEPILNHAVTTLNERVGSLSKSIDKLREEWKTATKLAITADRCLHQCHKRQRLLFDL